MMEPRRLLEEARGLDRAVLESAIEDDPSPERRQRLLASFGGTSLALLTSTGAASRLGAWKLTAWKIVVGIAVTTGVGIGAAALAEDASSPSHARPATSSHGPAVAAAPVTSADPVASAGSATSPVTTADVVPSSAPTAPLAQAPRRAPGAAPVSIGREIELIDRARDALATGDSKTALATLREYDVACRGGAMSLEAEVLRIEAVAASGDEEGASKQARAFIEKHPRTAYDARVRVHLANP